MSAGHKIVKGDIVIKDIAVLRALMERNYHPLLITIICDVAQEFGLVITESWREKRHDNDVHGVIPGRGMDLRFFCYESEQKAYNIMHWINRKWIYDPRRTEYDVAKIHDSGKGIHFHIQAHPHTRRRHI